MNYYYDVVLNFSDINILFYEWNKFDNLELYKRVPIIQVNSKTLNDFINNNVVVDENFLEMIKDKAKKKGDCPSYIAIFADRNGSIALEFDEKGKSLYRSFLDIDDDLNISEFLYTVDIMKVSYEIKDEIKYNDCLRMEDEIKLLIKTEINSLHKKKDFVKLKYLYMEWFNKVPYDNEKIYDYMINKLNDKVGIEEKRIYDLIKLSYNKV